MSWPDEKSADLSESFLSQARDQLAAAHQLIRHAAGQLDDSQIWWRPRDSQNSIGNLLLHVTGNLRQRLLDVVGGQPQPRDRDREFAERTMISKDDVLAKLDEVVAACDHVLARLKPPELLEPRTYAGINHQFELDVMSVVFRTVLHLAGHAQEIVFMTRLQLGESYQFANPTPKKA